jgi:haloacetate dehalogenase
MPKNIEFVSVPECGHLPHEEKPKFVNDTLQRFLTPWKG